MEVYFSRGEIVAKNKPKLKCSECTLRPAACPSADQVDDTIKLLVKRTPLTAERARVLAIDLDELIGHNCKDIVAVVAGDQGGE